MTGVLEEFNQYFSLELAQKVNRGLRESWLKGNYTGGQGKYGYDVVEKKLVINPEEAAIVLEIFTKYSQGYKAADIARNLVERGVRRKDGNFLEHKYLYTILHNSRYTGKVTLQGQEYDNIYPRIISDELWAVVDAINNENKIAPSRKKAIFDYILTGKLVCGNCHKLMSGESGTSHTGDIHYYYVCTARRKKKAKCSTQAIKKQWLEDTVINTTMQMLKKENNIHEIAINLFELHKAEANKDSSIKILQKKYADVLKARNNIIKAIEVGIITDSTKDRLCELEAELSQVEFDIEKEKQHTYTFLTVENIETYLQKQVYEDTTDIEIRKLIVNTFIREVIAYDDKLIITYNFCDITDTTKITIDGTIEIEERSKTALSSKQSSCIFSTGAPKKQVAMTCFFFLPETPTPILLGFSVCFSSGMLSVLLWGFRFFRWECFPLCFVVFRFFRRKCFPRFVSGHVVARGLHDGYSRTEGCLPRKATDSKTTISLSESVFRSTPGR